MVPLYHIIIRTLQVEEVVMKFCFSAHPESPSMAAVFHLLVREVGGEPEFEGGKVITIYNGETEDETFKEIIKLYEAQPDCIITLSTK